MELIENIIGGFNNIVNTYVVPTWLLMTLLLGTGLFLTLRLGFIQLRRLKHGIEVTTGKFDDPNETGDVSHFQALTTALSATVGVGNIAGVAAAIHWGGPGALFWMWVTAFLGMAVKFSEVTLALKYRDVDKGHAGDIQGSVSGGPMYYIEKGMGTKWKPLAIFFAIGLMTTAFFTGNAVQANTLVDQIHSNFGIAKPIIGAVSVTLVGIVIFGGIKRIGKVTSILAPVMAAIYVFGALAILIMNIEILPSSFALIIKEAFNPTAGVAGAGTGAFLATLTWGVKRGLFSNEAGQGSAPIAHAAAQTEEPVSEGVVALLEPFIDTLVICTITGLVIISTGVWNTKHDTDLVLSSGDFGFMVAAENGVIGSASEIPNEVIITSGLPQVQPNQPFPSWHEASIDTFFVDEAQTMPFNGKLIPGENKAVGSDGTEYTTLYGKASETGAPLTAKAFQSKLGALGNYIVLFCVVLFALSTAISWSYYGDRCAKYAFGDAAIVPYKILYLGFHLIGALISLDVIWALGDTALSIVTLPNLLALLILSGVIAKETNSYFDRKPWEKHRK